MGVPPWHAMSVASARRVEDDVFGGTSRTVGFVRDLAIPGPRGEIPLRVYRDTDDPRGTLVFYHGGGWTLGTLDSAGDLCRELAARTDRVVVSVDYRLAPEHPFPEGLDDAYAALEWVNEHADTFDGAGDIAVAGTSAGGNLAAAVALRARDHDGPALSHQALLYPITNHAFDTESYRENADGPLLTRADMEWFWERYVRSPVDAANPYASVLRAPDHSDLPDATVVTAGHDPLRDDGTAYADALDRAGTPVEHHHYPSMAHGFLSLTDSVGVADDAMAAVADHL
ncbi:alpha/beta hydrolase [Salarchaeum sp. III]|uniref:alpha/beta hydrolase n=1 Tax=Salarchaeum sp. III TaxID=3107927 RepID=UPI003FA7507C